MGRMNTPEVLWLLCLLFIVKLFNHVGHVILNGQNPIFVATGERADISKFLCFHWLQTFYYYSK